jgi:hypothetical protein
MGWDRNSGGKLEGNYGMKWIQVWKNGGEGTVLT